MYQDISRAIGSPHIELGLDLSSGPDNPKLVVAYRGGQLNKETNRIEVWKWQGSIPLADVSKRLEEVSDPLTHLARNTLLYGEKKDSSTEPYIDL